METESETAKKQGEEDYKVGPGKPPIEDRFKPGESGNPNGRPKGTKNLSTLVREMMEDENFDFSNIPTMSADQKEWAKKTGSPWKVLISVAFAKSYAGDTKAMEFLRKSGYGDKLDITSLGKALAAPLIISPIETRHVETEDETAAGD